MLRTPTPRLLSRWAGIFLLGMVTSAGSALACTAADMAASTGHEAAEMHDASMVQMTPAARLDARASMAPADGLKLRMRQQDSLLSAYLPPASLGAQARPASLPTSTDRSAALSERPSSSLPAQPAPDTPAEHTYKPLAMLAAALALMVSIAVRRSGKR